MRKSKLRSECCLEKEKTRRVQPLLGRLFLFPPPVAGMVKVTRQSNNTEKAAKADSTWSTFLHKIFSQISNVRERPINSRRSCYTRLSHGHIQPTGATTAIPKEGSLGRYAIGGRRVSHRLLSHRMVSNRREEIIPQEGGGYPMGGFPMGG